MKNTTQKIIEYVLSGLGLCGLVFLIAFENNADQTKRCNGIKVELVGGDDEFFISPSDVTNYITRNGMEPLEGKLLSQIKLSEVEKEVLKIKQIQSCEVFGDLQGNINIKAKPYLPYARILKKFGPDYYMDAEGGFFPLSKYYSARVMLISGDYFENKTALDPEKDADLINLIKSIKANRFWNAEISRMFVSSDKSINFLTITGDQLVKFGRPDDIEGKLKKLMVFYKKILPTQEWGQFQEIDIHYKNQIVCKN